MTNDVTAQGGIENTGPFIQGNINATVTLTTTTAATTFVPAQPTGIRAFLTSIQVVNSSATATYVTITDGTTTIYLAAPASSGNNYYLGTNPFISKAATIVTATAANSVTSVFVSCLGYGA